MPDCFILSIAEDKHIQIIHFLKFFGQNLNSQDRISCTLPKKQGKPFLNSSFKKAKDKVIGRTKFERRLYHANNGLLRAKSTSARSTARQGSSSGVFSSWTNRARIAGQYQHLELRSPERVNFATRARVQRIYLSTTD